MSQERILDDLNPAKAPLPVAPPLPLFAATVDDRTLRELLSVTREELAEDYEIMLVKNFR